MSAEITSYVSEAEAKLFARNNLSAHVRQLRRRNRGVSRWLTFAAILGAAIAVGFVVFFAR